MNSIWNIICKEIYKNKHKDILSGLKIAIYYYATKKFNVRLIHIIKHFIIIFVRLSKYNIQKDMFDIVFFLPYNTPSNVDNLFPVVNSSIAAGKKTLLILGEDFDENTISNLPHCKYVCINKLYGNMSVILKISNLLTAARLLIYIHKVFKKYPVINVSIRSNFIGFYYHIYLVLFYRNIFNLLFSKLHSKCAVSTSDFWPEENQFVQSAKEHFYNTYIIQHGIISEFWWPFDAEYYFVWGDLHKDQLINQGAKGDKIVVVGMPALDRNYQNIPEYRNKYNNKINILIISQTHAPIFSEIIYKKYASCLSVLNEMERDFIVTVKLHPNEGMRFYDKYGFSNLKNIIFIKHERPIQDLIIESDLCITFFSTGGLEAIALNRPLVIMNLDGWIEDMAWWPKHGGGLYISNDISFKELLIKISEDEKYINMLVENQKVFMRKSFSNCGNSSNIIIKVLLSDMNNSYFAQH